MWVPVGGAGLMPRTIKLKKRRAVAKSMVRPEYAIPSLAQIKAVERNGLRFVSTFSGCGGGCLGLTWAGYECLWASEFVPEAAATYRANFPDTPVDTRDIRTVGASDIRAVIGDVDIDLLEGSPPCASFSNAGIKSEGWGRTKKYSDVEQRTDDLFDEFVRLLGELRPRAFYAENVPGLAQGVSKGVYLSVLRSFREQGYDVDARVLDSQWLGVPQMRKRLFFVGIREDVAHESVPFPSPLSYRYSIRDALPWIKGVRGGWAQPFDSKHQPFSVEEPSRTIIAGAGNGPQLFEVEAETWLEGYAIAPEWDKLGPGELSQRYYQLWKPDPEQPVPTVTATAGITGSAGVTHPTERRKFSIAELRRLCGFPDDFILTGRYTQQWERLGRAVSPPVSRALGEALAPVLLAGR